MKTSLFFLLNMDFWVPKYFFFPLSCHRICHFESQSCTSWRKYDILFQVEIPYNKDICHLQLNNCRFIRLSSKFYYKSGQWSADFITVVRVHKPSSCPTDYIICFSYRFLVPRYEASWISTIWNVVFVQVGFRLSTAWANGTVLRPISTTRKPHFPHKSLVSGFKCKLRDSNSWPECCESNDLTTRLYTIHIVECVFPLFDQWK